MCYISVKQRHTAQAPMTPVILQLAILLCTASGARLLGRSQCLPTFKENDPSFSKCKASPCFLFISEVPEVTLDPSMRDSPPVLFPCHHRPAQFPRLKGLFFDLVDAIPAMDDAFCVYAGPQCSFDGMVDFTVAQTPNGYQFAVGGFMVFLSYRLKTETQFSAPFLEGIMLMIARRKEPIYSITGAFSTIFAPFDGGSWMLVCIFMVLFAVLALAASAVFSPSLSFKEALTRLMYSNDELAGQHAMRKKPRLVERVLWRSLSVSAAVFFAVLVLLYEISVATRVFENREANTRITFSEIRNDNKPEKYVTIRNSATEYVFRWTVNASTSSSHNESKKSWSSASSTHEMIDMILNPNHPAEYGISQSDDIGNMLASRKLCDKIVVLRMDPPLHKFSGGWYYSTQIPVEKRKEIDKQILDLRLRDAITEMGRKYISVPLSCGSGRTIISAAIIFVLILLTVLPFLSVAIFSLLFSCVMRMVHGFAQENEMATRSSEGGDVEKLV